MRFEGAGMEVRREDGRSDVTIWGSASDLLLFLWHRIPASRLEIVGDRSMVERYFEFVPHD